MTQKNTRPWGKQEAGFEGKIKKQSSFFTPAA